MDVTRQMHADEARATEPRLRFFFSLHSSDVESNCILVVGRLIVVHLKFV